MSNKLFLFTLDKHSAHHQCTPVSLRSHPNLRVFSAGYSSLPCTHQPLQLCPKDWQLLFKPDTHCLIPILISTSETSSQSGGALEFFHLLQQPLYPSLRSSEVTASALTINPLIDHLLKSYGQWAPLTILSCLIPFREGARMNQHHGEGGLMADWCILDLQAQIYEPLTDLSRLCVM